MNILKNNLFTLVLGVIFVVLLMNRCTSKRILKKYYVLDNLADSTLIQHKPLPFNVIIEPFWAAPAYRTKQIALRTQEHELQFYYYHQWSETPESAIRFLLWRKLQQANIFQNCDLAVGAVYPQYGISGTIDGIEVQNPGKTAKFPIARLKGRLELFDFQSRKTLVLHEFSNQQPLPKKFSMNQFATAINQMANQELDVFIRKILQTLQK